MIHGPVLFPAPVVGEYKEHKDLDSWCFIKGFICYYKVFLDWFIHHSSQNAFLYFLIYFFNQRISDQQMMMFWCDYKWFLQLHKKHDEGCCQSRQTGQKWAGGNERLIPQHVSIPGSDPEFKEAFCQRPLCVRFVFKRGADLQSVVTANGDLWLSQGHILSLWPWCLLTA